MLDSNQQIKKMSSCKAPRYDCVGHCFGEGGALVSCIVLELLNSALFCLRKGLLNHGIILETPEPPPCCC